MIDRSIQYNSRKDHLQMDTSFIKGVVVPILTICDKDEKIDEAKQRAQVDYVIKGGVTGILAFGSNGEFYMLEEDEMERGLKIMVDQAAGRVPVNFGIGAISTKKCCRLARMAVANGAAAVSVLQPELKRPPRRDLEGEGGRKANPRSRRHGGVKHELARRALSMDSRGDDAYCRDSSASPAASVMSLSGFFYGALDSGVQGQRKPRRRPLVPGPRCLLLSTLISVAEDQPLLRRKRVRTLSGGLPLLFGRKPTDWCHWRKEEQEQGRRRKGAAGRNGLKGLSQPCTYSRRRPTVGLHDRR